MLSVVHERRIGVKTAVFSYAINPGTGTAWALIAA